MQRNKNSLLRYIMHATLTMCLLLVTMVPAWAGDLTKDVSIHPSGNGFARDSLPIAGEWAGQKSKINIEVSNQTVAAALDIFARKTGLGLVLEADVGPGQNQPITLKLKRVPAREVLGIILKNGDLVAEVKNGILFVNAAPETANPARPAAQTSDAGAKTLSPVAGSLPMISVVPGKGHPHKHGPGQQAEDRVQVGESLRIEAGEEVKDAVAVGGDLTVLGRVQGDAVSIGGSVHVKPGAHVQGEAVSVGGSVNVDSGATVEGGQVGIGIPIGGFVDMIKRHKDRPAGENGVIPGLAGTFAAFSVLGFLLRTVLLFVCCLIVIASMPSRVATVRTYLAQKPAQSILAGIAVLIALVPVIVLLAITVIGIPLIPVVLIGLPLIMLFGLTALFSWFGYRIPLFASRKGQIGATAIGVLIFMLLSLVPYAGPVLLTLAAFASVGAAILSRFGLDSAPKLPASPSVR